MALTDRARLGALLLLATLAPLPVLAVQDCEIDGQSVNPANGATTADKSGLMRCRDRDTGQVVREQQFQAGVPMGVVRHYQGGKLAKEFSVDAKGNRDGVAREYAPEGELIYQTTYENGRETGLARSFYPNGQLRRATFFGEPGERASAEFTPRGQLSALRCGDKPLLAPTVDDAKLCGFPSGPSQVELFDDAGKLRSRLTFASGKRTRAEELYDNGRPASRMVLDGDQRLEQRWSSDGVKRSEVAWALGERGAVKVREQSFSERGTLVRDQRWNAQGQALSDQSFFLNGQPKSQATYADESIGRTLDLVEYFDNGQRASIGRYRLIGRTRQLPIGKHQRFAEDGRLRAESEYDDGGRLQRERTWDDSGRAERDDLVFEDGSRRAFTR